MRIISRSILIVLICSLPTFSSNAAHSLNVVINEIAWMGTDISYTDEWIELYNNTDGELNLEGWKIKTMDENFSIVLSGKIRPKSFYILERGDDGTIPNLPASQIYKGNLDNTGEILSLFDEANNVVDKIECGSGWFSGNNSTKQTMERKNPSALGSTPGNWQNSENPGGTPNLENSFLPGIINNAYNKTPEEDKNINMSPAHSSPGIFINEVLPSPAGKDSLEEWIEIYNSNPSEADISNWQIADKAGARNIYILPSESKISAFDFLLLKRPFTKIILNNDEDGIVLSDSSQRAVSSMSYKKAPKGYSFAREGSNWSWDRTPTPGGKNIIDQEEKFLAGTEVTENGKIRTGSLPEIVLNEILPSPEGPDETEEWLEIFNKGDKDISLTGWKIQDLTGSLTSYTIPENTVIRSKEFFTLTRPITKITLNNDSDGLKILEPQGEVIDEVAYQKAPQGQSYNRENSNWLWSNNLTPGAPNAVLKVPANNKEETKSFHKKNAESIKGSFLGLPIFLLSGALIMAVSYGTIILVLKKRFKKI